MADRVEQVMEELRAVERERRRLIAKLQELGAIRSWGIVADYGETLAATYYGVELEPPSTPGFDLVRGDGAKVQVRTLRVTPENKRASMGVMKEPYDLLLAIRIDQDYIPIEVIEVPRGVLEAHYPAGSRTTWTKKLGEDDGVRRIPPEQLLPC